MEDTTKPSSSVQPPTGRGRLAVDAADLLISDKAAWEMWPVTKSALGCSRGQKLGVSVRNGELVTFSPPCRTLGHKPCAEEKVKGYLQQVDRNLVSARSGWMALVEEAAYDKDQLRKRLYEYRRGHPDAAEAWYRVVKRSDGTRWIMSTVPLGGRFAPVSMEPVDDLLAFAAEALRLPGVVGFRGTHWPIKSPGDSGSDLHSFGSITDEMKEEFLVAVADEVERCFGVKVDPLVPLAYRSGITVEQYIECGDAVRLRQ